jgi:hypothetical protein
VAYPFNGAARCNYLMVGSRSTDSGNGLAAIVSIAE